MMKEVRQSRRARAGRRGAAGFTLIDVMVAMGIGAIAVVTTIGVIVQAGRIRRENNLQTSLLAVRTLIFNTLQRFDDFQATIHYAPNAASPAKFACLQSLTCPASAGGTNFALLYSSYSVSKPGGLILYDPRNAKAGFDQNGLRCDPPPTTNPPNATCPIRVDFSWVNKCASCNPGLIEITVKFKTYRSWAPAPQRVRTTPYDFTLIKSVYPETAGPNW